VTRLVTRERIVRVDRVFKRFDALQRIEHAVLLVVIGILLLTGLPQKYAQVEFSALLIDRLGGILTVRLIHRVAALLLIAGGFAHVAGALYRLLVLRLPPYMVLLLSDFRDMLQDVRYRLGAASEPPDMGRYTYQEKLLYWAAITNLLMLILTGLVMWKPVLITQLLPGEVIPAAKASHGFETLFLLMVTFGWRVWYVIRQRNLSIFTGTMSEEAMLHNHPLEWDAIMAGTDRRPLYMEAVRKRRRVFFIWTALLALLSGAGLALFVGSAPTAIDTHVEPQPLASDSADRSLSSLTPTATPVWPKPIWEKDIRPLLVTQCADCHGSGSPVDLTRYETILKGGAGGPLIVPGDASSSALVTVQASGEHPGQLTGDELALVIVWIMNGAPR
jgi:cytochrome b subunit of formate dehydrogenase